MKSHKSYRLSIWGYFKDFVRDLVLDRLRGPLTIRRIDRHLARGSRELEAGLALAEHFNTYMHPALAGRLWRYTSSGRELSDRAGKALDRAERLKIKLHGKSRQSKAERGRALSGVVKRKKDKEN